jgi:hypothetical protein
MDVHLNVYDLHDSNRYLHSMGTGFYHTGVEVNGYEYSFSDAGVMRTKPRLDNFGVLRDHVLMGQFDGAMGEVNQILSSLREGDFRPGTYNVTTRNCNHFSDAFMMLLLEIHIPNWVNRMANAASSLPIGQQQQQQQPNAGFSAPGKVKDPTLPVKIEVSKKPEAPSEENNNPGLISSIFSWFGNSPAPSQHAVPPPVASQPVQPAVNTTKPATTTPGKKKELTEQQKQLLAKMKK